MDTKVDPQAPERQGEGSGDLLLREYRSCEHASLGSGLNSVQANSHSQECKGLGNFTSLRAIVLALQSTSIGQLKRTKEEATPAVAQNLRQMEDLVDSNRDYDIYRGTLRSFRGAVLPILCEWPTSLWRPAEITDYSGI